MISDTKIGVLYLQSAHYKTMSRDFIRGIKMNDLPVQYFMESIGTGANDRLIIDKIQKLHHQDEVTFIIAFLGHHNIKAIYEYAAENEIILIASDLGATMPYGIGKHEGVYINSYGLNESSYLLGEYFAKNDIKNIFSSSSYYDAGYGMLAAMDIAIQKNNLSFSGHYITPFHPRETESTYMNEAMSGKNTDAVFGFYSGLYAEEHSDFIAQTNLLNELTYYLTPFSVKKNVYYNKLNPIFVIGSWLGNSDHDLNSLFIEQYKKEYNNAPSIFSLLGYENSIVLKTILENEDSDSSYKSLLAKMKTLTAEGPRGTICFEKNTNRTVFNHYLYKIVANDENNFSYQRVETLKNDGGFIQAILFHESPSQPGGWQNAYLCH
ncbi:ABC transporter substrate-binding protein [Flavobacterium sp. LaA7.5]|nr:ABC transporter substrate-binding protein [Flavobacterium salilacus subsp. altitudinum]